MHRTTADVIAAATALALLSTATLATASDGGVPDCPPAEEHEVGPIDQDVVLDKDYYLNLEDDEPQKLGLWKEANSWFGLQTEGGECNYFGELKTYSPDVQVESLEEVE